MLFASGETQQRRWTFLETGSKGWNSRTLYLAKDRLGSGVELERLQEGLVDGVETLLLPGSSQTSGQHEIIGLNTSNGVGLSKRELVLGQSASPVDISKVRPSPSEMYVLVRAKNFDAGK